MSKRSLRRVAAGALLLAASVMLASCGKVARQGTSPSFLIIDSLGAASGATPNQFGNVLESDVITLVKVTRDSDTSYVPTIYEDFGQVKLRAGLKDPGTAQTPASPSVLNEITITQYHVNFVRSDGRNTPGVDIPYPFDGAVTGTITGDGNSFTFVLVRAQAKAEPPLKPLQNNGGAMIISTIAQVTFYGKDQAGNEVSVTGTISVNFADWGDPQ
jgi:hypothetical protein